MKFQVSRYEDSDFRYHDIISDITRKRFPSVRDPFVLIV